MSRSLSVDTAAPSPQGPVLSELLGILFSRLNYTYKLGNSGGVPWFSNSFCTVFASS
jgi:hypothetical protein